MAKLFKKLKLSVWQYLAIGYLTVILVGSLLLSLPVASRTPTAYVDALFTATSATCVTGLVPVDTATHWTLFGQIVILCMIQLGGLGFMTFVSAIFRAIGKNMGLYETKALMLSAGEEERNDLWRLLRRILLGTLFFEGLGFLLLSIRFVGDFGFARGTYFALFHAISSFCNAGFDVFGGVFGGNTFVSLTHYATDPLVILTIGGLIAFGGLGFCVWDDVVEQRFNLKKCRLHTKVVLSFTAVLILSSTVLFMVFEWNNSAFGNTFNEKLLSAVFASITPRTAGFNSVDLTQMSDSSYFLTIILMVIGGSTGSTAGGVKVSTFAVILTGMVSVFRGKKDVEIGKRRLHAGLLHQALAVFIAYLFAIVLATLLICAIENANPVLSGNEFMPVFFEVVSAIGTVGLSLSLTPFLSVASKTILMLLMYLGRVGVLTLVFALRENKSSATSQVKKPVDTMLIG